MLFNLQALRVIAALLVVMHHSLPHFRAMGLSNPVFEFIAGYFICQYWRYLSARHWIWIALLAGAAGLSVGVQLGNDHGHWRFSAITLFPASLVWLMLLLESHALVTFRGLIKKVGDSSYTLYLTHTVLLGLFYSLGIRDYLVAHDFALSGFIACIAFITLISWVFYNLHRSAVVPVG